MTGGASAALYGIPIVVTPTESLHPAVEEYLQFYSPTTTILFGETAALSEEVERAVPNPQRIFGPERAATAAEIYRASGPDPNTPGRFVIVNGSVENGWAFGLPAGGLAADNGAGLLLVGGDVPQPTVELVSACGAPEVEMLVVGSEALVSRPVFDELNRLDGEAC